MAEENVKVAVRVRPFNSREKARDPELIISMDGPRTTIRDPSGQHADKTFTFDYSYWSHSGFEEKEDKSLHKVDAKYATQEDVFNDLGQGVLNNAYEGYNTSLFAYGQTGAGKSYSMVGYGPNKGIVPLAFEALFQKVHANDDENTKYQVMFSMLEIYMEQVEDLLADPKLRKKGGLKVRQNPQLGRFYVDGLSKIPVSSYDEISNLMDQGTANRTVAATQMNATSSRAHTVVTLQFDQIITKDGQKTTKQSEVNLVDLAGSERAGSTGATGDRLKEGAQINKSLSALGNVISALASSKKAPFRDSVLTKLLQNSLGGNSKTIMIAALSPASINYDETLSTLRYADRAKQIKTKAAVNESATDKLIRQLREENERMKKLLDGGNLEMSTEGKTDEEIAKMKRKSEAALLAHIKNTEDQMARLDGTAHEQQSEYWKQQYEEAAKIESDKAEKLATVAHLVNLNEDPALSGVVIHFLKDGQNLIGRKGTEGAGPDIALSGLSMSEKHAEIVIADDGTVTLTQNDPSLQDKMLVNGAPTLGTVQLAHRSRLLFGTNHLYIFHNPKGTGGSENDALPQDIDWEYAQKEILDNKPKMEHDMSLPAAVQEEIEKLLPMIGYANDVSAELEKHRKFQFTFVNPLYAGGDDTAATSHVKMTNLETGNEWLLSSDEFIERRFRIEEMYRKHQQGGEGDDDDDDDDEADDDDDEDTTSDATNDDAPSDPFHHDTADVVVGTVNVPLDGLAYNLDFDDDVFIQNYEARSCGTLEVAVQPCTAEGGPVDFIDDPDEMLGKPLYFKLIIRTAFLKDPRWRTGVKLCYSHEYIEQDTTWVESSSGDDLTRNSVLWSHERILSIPNLESRHLEWLQTAGGMKLVIYAQQTDGAVEAHTSSTTKVKDLLGVLSEYHASGRSKENALKAIEQILHGSEPCAAEPPHDDKSESNDVLALKKDNKELQEVVSRLQTECDSLKAQVASFKQVGNGKEAKQAGETGHNSKDEDTEKKLRDQEARHETELKELKAQLEDAKRQNSRDGDLKGNSTKVGAKETEDSEIIEGTAQAAAKDSGGKDDKSVPPKPKRSSSSVCTIA